MIVDFWLGLLLVLVCFFLFEICCVLLLLWLYVCGVVGGFGRILCCLCFCWFLFCCSVCIGLVFCLMSFFIRIIVVYVLSGCFLFLVCCVVEWFICIVFCCRIFICWWCWFGSVFWCCWLFSGVWCGFFCVLIVGLVVLEFVLLNGWFCVLRVWWRLCIWLSLVR